MIESLRIFYFELVLFGWVCFQHNIITHLTEVFLWASPSFSCRCHNRFDCGTTTFSRGIFFVLKWKIINFIHEWKIFNFIFAQWRKNIKTLNEIRFSFLETLCVIIMRLFIISFQKHVSCYEVKKFKRVNLEQLSATPAIHISCAELTEGWESTLESHPEWNIKLMLSWWFESREGRAPLWSQRDEYQWHHSHNRLRQI